MIIDLNEEEIEWIKRVCKRVIEFEGMGITVSNIKDSVNCRKLLDKLENSGEN